MRVSMAIRRRRAQALNGVAPRGGFAWSLGERSVVRGGYGFYWAPNQYAGLGEAAIGSKRLHGRDDVPLER